MKASKDNSSRNKTTSQWDYRKIQDDIMGAIPEPVAFIDGSYRYVYVNNAYSKYFRKTADQIEGLTIAELTGTNYFNEVKEHIDKCLSGVDCTYQKRLVLPDEQEYYVRVDLKTHYNEKGEVDGVISSSKDITGLKLTQHELKESEIKFRQLAENIHQVFWLTDWKNKKLLYVSPAYEVVFGLSCESAYADPKGWRKVVHPDDLQKVNDTFSSDFTNQNSIEVEYRLLMRDGSMKWILDRSYPVMDKTGDIYRMVSLAEDITERKNAEQALIESENRLREANASKDKFFSIIAHDLRSPFNSIMGYTDLMLEKSARGETDDVFRISSILNDMAGQSYNLLNNLLEWSRSQTKSLQFVRSRFSLSKLIHEQVESSQTSARQKGVKIFVQTDNVDIYGDENMMRTIIRNLLSNAIKFTKVGGKVIISADEHGDEVEVSVKDTGVGISEDNIEKLFQIGEGFSRPGTNKERGSGLGLILCKEFTELHKGEMHVSSEPGKGSVFRFRIPGR